MLEKNKVYKGRMEELILQLDDNSVDVILTDPPFLYLKNQKLDIPFDEELFFSNVKRVLKKNGFIVLFGRGTSFYRWNTMLAALGFNFKEEIIWNKNYGSSPLMAITRVHETISIYSKGNGIINKVKIPYIEQKGHSLSDIHRDIKRLKTIISNPNSFAALEKYLNTGELSFDGNYKSSTTITSGRKRVDRVVSTAQMIIEGMNEKSIIQEIRDHYTSIHPTQKPVRLLERLLQLILPKNLDNPLILDAFAGSCSTLIAGVNLGCDVIGFEKDAEYYDSGSKRFYEHLEKKQNEKTA